MSDLSSQKLIDEMRTLRDEIRLKIHLGGMDARAAWENLEVQFREVERAFRIKAGRIKSSLEKLRDEIVVRD